LVLCAGLGLGILIDVYVFYLIRTSFPLIAVYSGPAYWFAKFSPGDFVGFYGLIAGIALQYALLFFIWYRHYRGIGLTLYAVFFASFFYFQIAVPYERFIWFEFMFRVPNFYGIMVVWAPFAVFVVLNYCYLQRLLKPSLSDRTAAVD